jgi:hypothetical protein
MGRFTVAIVGAVSMLTLAPGHGWANTLFLFGNQQASNTATVNFIYTALSATRGRVNIGLANTSSSTTVGRRTFNPTITALAFNLPSNVTGLNGGVLPTGWGSLLDPNHITTPQAFGRFDFCVDASGNTDNTCNNGRVRLGIAPSATGNFQFTFTGTGMNTLTASSFLSVLSVGNKNQTPVAFTARFQNTPQPIGSDVAIPGAPSPNTVPEPGPVILYSTVVVALGLALRKRIARAKRDEL